MRSKDVAEAAHVSIRTLRHYHDLGLLPEPPRSQNGYRDYTALDVARVLRIKRLTSLGFSLSDIAHFDSASSEDFETTLEALDKELARKIDALQEQRHIIAELRAEHLDPTLPPKFARAIKSFYGEDGLIGKQDLTEEDKAALLIAGSLYSESDSEELERFIKEAQNRGAVDNLRFLDNRINALAPHATEEEQTMLVNEAMSILEPLLDTLDPNNWLKEDDANWSLVDSLVDTEPNPAKKAVTVRIGREIIDRMQKRAESNARTTTDKK